MFYKESIVSQNIIQTSQNISIDVYPIDAVVYSCLNSKSFRADKLNLAATLKKDLQSVVNRDRKSLVNFLSSKLDCSHFILAIGIADARHLVNVSLCLVGLMFSTDFKVEQLH